MENDVLLAFYKKEGNIRDRIIRFFTKSKYSHCEIVLKTNNTYVFYTASFRDGGVRKKEMSLDDSTWDFISTPWVDRDRIIKFYESTKGKRYDWLGVIFFFSPFDLHLRNRWFCSEWCAAALDFEKAYFYSPEFLNKTISEIKKIISIKGERS